MSSNFLVIDPEEGLAAIKGISSLARVKLLKELSKRPGINVNDLAQVSAHPQVKSRGLQFELPHPLAGTVPSVANPIRMSATPPRYESAPPLLGQHTREVLGRLGLDERELEALARDGII